MDFARDVLAAADPGGVAMIELARDGSRRDWTFAAAGERSARVARRIADLGVGRGDVVLTLIGNRPEWVFAMVACFRIGAVVLPANEQLRAKDLRMRIEAVRPKLVIADERNRSELEGALGGLPGIEVLAFPDDDLVRRVSRGAVRRARPGRPCLITFTSGTSGEPKPVVHAQRYLPGQRLQARHWLAPEAGDVVWCTATSGWSKSARNAFVAPWLRGATTVLHDRPFDPAERLEIIDQAGVNVLCMSPTEYRLLAKRGGLRRAPSLRGLVAAGEALNAEVLRTWRDATGLDIRDGYGQTETGQLTANPPGQPARPGSMGRPLPGVKLWVESGELVADPSTIPTFFLGYGRERHQDAGTYSTGDRVRVDDDGYLFFEGRTDDVIISAGYRIGPFEVESALVAHHAVAEAAVVAAPDDERGSIVRAVVVLREPHRPSAPLAKELQDHVKATTAPYKYPRRVDFVARLPKTSSGKIRRAALREQD